MFTGKGFDLLSLEDPVIGLNDQWYPVLQEESFEGINDDAGTFSLAGKREQLLAAGEVAYHEQAIVYAVNRERWLGVIHSPDAAGFCPAQGVDDILVPAPVDEAVTLPEFFKLAA